MFSTFQLGVLIVTGIAGIATILTVLWKAYERYHIRLHVKRIEEPTDPDLVESLRLEEAEFGGNVIESIDDARRWLQELNREKALRTNWFDEYRIVVKENKSVIACI